MATTKVTLKWCKAQIHRCTEDHRKLDLRVVVVLAKARHGLGEAEFDAFKEWCVRNYRIIFPSVVAFDCYLAVADELLPTSALDLISYGGGTYMREGLQMVRTGKITLEDLWAAIEESVAACDLKPLRIAVGRDRKRAQRKTGSKAVFKFITAVRKSPTSKFKCILELDNGMQVAVRKCDAPILKKFL